MSAYPAGKRVRGGYTLEKPPIVLTRGGGSITRKFRKPSKHIQWSKINLKARDKVGDGEIVIMKDFAKKGENSRA